MWTLTSPDAVGAASGPESFHLPKDGSAHIVVTGSIIGVIRTLVRIPGQVELGRITVGPWGVKLEAILEPLIIVPDRAHAGRTAITAGDPTAVNYELKPRSDERSEILILRHGDVIRFSRSAPSLACKWITSQVQVDSSAADKTAIELPASTGNIESLEDETEDEDLDEATEAAMATNQPKATPVPCLSNQRSVVVQETPTADRVIGAMQFTNAIDTNEENHALVGNQVSSGVADSVEEEVEAEAYSSTHTKISRLGNAKVFETTGRLTKNDIGAGVGAPIVDSASASAKSADDEAPPPTKSSPRVEILQRASRKRNSPTTDDVDLERGRGIGSRSNKRTKRDAEDQNDTQDSRMSFIDVDIPRNSKTVVAAKGKKRSSEISEAPVETPPRSQRSSQRSNTAATDSTPYDGPAPRVAVSNSSITKASQAVKFLKKHGGFLIESADEAFNILCVRDGGLVKTSKLLLSIARGTPIVTDKWLLESAKAGHFLATSSYIPIAPVQEKEWGIQLDKVIGHPQTPFAGYTIHFTKSLKATYTAFTEIEHVCKAAGAKKTTTTTSRVDKVGNSIVLATEEDDAEMEKLMQDGITCYHKDLITQSILRGVLDLDSAEFKIGTDAAPKDKKKKPAQKASNIRGKTAELLFSESRATTA